MGITTAQLPDNSSWLALSFCLARDLVNVAILAVSPLYYQQAVYNLAGSNLLNFAQDPKPTVVYPPNDPWGLGFFAFTRKTYNMLGFVSGVIQAAADESTSESMVVPDAFKDFTLMNLQQLKDPYGRFYLSVAQEYGPAAWGLTT